MAYILHIETTSTVCSVAISQGAELMAMHEINNGYTHAENLHVFIQQVLKEASLDPKQLQAISVSSGPGSYTGLRIGFSSAKGFAYALQIPLISVDSLKALTALAIQKTQQDAYYCPMLDARRMEVYTALYSNQLQGLIPVNALILNEQSIEVFRREKPVYFFGDGMPKAKELLKSLPQVEFIEGISASSRLLIDIAYQKYMNQDFADMAYAEPLYLKEFFFQSSQK